MRHQDRRRMSRQADHRNRRKSTFQIRQTDKTDKLTQTKTKPRHKTPTKLPGQDRRTTGNYFVFYFVSLIVTFDFDFAVLGD